MATSNLRTNFKRIGRSGATVDGREIKPEQLRQAAANYDPKLFTALIWPEHSRWYNMGKVIELRVEDNSEGGVDLFAVLAPNDEYLWLNKQGQKLFTSMELKDDFRNTGETYLTGLGATDNPASAATEEMRFSQTGDKAIQFGDNTEATDHEFTNTNDESTPNWFTNFLNKYNGTDMDKKALATLQTQLAALQTQFKDLSVKPENNEKPEDKDESANFSALSDAVTVLTDKFTALEEKLTAAGDEENTDAADKFKALETSLKELTEKFKAALGEQDGTAIDDEPNGDNVDDCL